MNAREAEAIERWRRLLGELPVAQLLGAEALAWHEDGERAEMAFAAPPSFCNLMDNVQSRLLTAMLDMAMAFSMICALKPDYVVPSTTLLGPEFALHNSSTYINRDNVLNTMTFGTIQPLASYPGATGTQPDWTALAALAGNPNALIDKLDALLLHGTMPAAMRTGLATAINAVAASDTVGRAKTAYYLVVTSSEYQVER